MVLLLVIGMLAFVACNDKEEEEHEHVFGDPAYAWSEDYSTCTATRVCAEDETHVEKETANATSVTTATCTEDGTRTYTAAFTNPAFTSQTKSVSEKATGHTYVNGTCSVCGDNETTESSYTSDFANALSDEWVQGLLDARMCWTTKVIGTHDFSGTFAQKGNKIYGVTYATGGALYTEDGQYYCEITDSEEYFVIYVKENGKWEKNNAQYGEDFVLGEYASLIYENKEEAMNIVSSCIFGYFESIRTTFASACKRTDYGTYYVYETTEGEGDEATVITLKADKTTGKPLELKIRAVTPSEDFESETETFVTPYEIVLPTVE